MINSSVEGATETFRGTCLYFVIKTSLCHFGDFRETEALSQIY